MSKNKSANTQIDNESIQQLARQLGVERRRYIRVLYPPNTSGGLPKIFFNKIPLRAQDISVGGLCLIDKHSVLGEKIGNDIELEMEWPAGQFFRILSRLVSRGAHRRNIQFLDLNDQARALIERHMQPGVCGLAMSTASHFQEPSSPIVQAQEIWHSALGNSLVFYQDIQKNAELVLLGQSFVLLHAGWPRFKDDPSSDVSASDVHAILLFLANINKPSPSILRTIQGLEAILLGVNS